MFRGQTKKNLKAGQHREFLEFINLLDSLLDPSQRLNVFTVSYLNIIKTMLIKNFIKNKFETFEWMLPDIELNFAEVKNPALLTLGNILQDKSKLQKIFESSFAEPLKKYDMAEKNLIDLINNAPHQVKFNYSKMHIQLQTCLTNSSQTSYSNINKVKKILENLTPQPVEKAAFNYHEKILREIHNIDPAFIQNDFERCLLKFSANREEEARLSKSEYRHHLFGIGLGDPSSLKISSVTHLLSHIHGDVSKPFTIEEVSALRGSHLGKIIAKYERLGVLPETFLKQEKELYEKRDNLQTTILFNYRSLF